MSSDTVDWAVRSVTGHLPRYFSVLTVLAGGGGLQNDDCPVRVWPYRLESRTDRWICRQGVRGFVAST